MCINKMVKPCDICGSNSVAEAIMTCCDCKIARQHLYCMKTYRTEVPQFWQCDECDPTERLSSPVVTNEFDPDEEPPSPGASDECDGNEKLASLDTNVEADLLNPSRQEVSGFVHRQTGVFAGVNKMNCASRFSYKERKVDKGKTKYISCDEAVNLSSGTKKWNSSSRAFHSGPIVSKPALPSRENTNFKPKPFSQNLPAKVNPTIGNLGEPKPSRPGNKQVVKPALQQSVVQPSSAPKAREEPSSAKDEPSQMHSPYVPAAHVYWKGNFFLPTQLAHFADAFNAHPPAKVHNKVYETLRKMPIELHFELVPHQTVRMDIFQDECPDIDDIGLYFFPIFKERSERYISILNHLWTEKVAMKTYLDGVELLVLSSRFLQSYSQKFEGEYFLWGVFRRVGKIAPRIPYVAPESNGKEEEEVDMDIDDPVVEGSIAKPQLLQLKSEPCDIPPGFESFKPCRG